MSIKKTETKTKSKETSKFDSVLNTIICVAAAAGTACVVLALLMIVGYFTWWTVPLAYLTWKFYPRFKKGYLLTALKQILIDRN